MSTKKTKTFNLIAATDAHMIRRQISLPREPHFYPSEASVKYIDENGEEKVEGGCLRKSFYRMTRTGDPDGTTPYSEWIFALGTAVEKILVEQWKQMGIWVGNNIKFYDKQRNISGELDCVIRDPGTNELICVEVKSVAGYNANKEVFGNKSTPGGPKTSQLLQTLIYVDQCTPLGINHFKMVYYSRDGADRREFNIDLIDDNGVKRPTIDGKVDYRFTMEDVYSRYSQLKEYLQTGELPPRDYEAEYTPEKIDRLYQLGEIGETAFVQYKKNPEKHPIGHWMCKRYCAFYKTCYNIK